MTSEIHITQHRVNGNIYDKYAIGTRSYKSRYNWSNNSCSIHIKGSEENISTVYNMVTYKLKVLHVDDDTQKFFPITQNDCIYHRLDNDCGDGYSTVIPDDG